MTYKTKTFQNLLRIKRLLSRLEESKYFAYTDLEVYYIPQVIFQQILLEHLLYLVSRYIQVVKRLIFLAAK